MAYEISEIKKIGIGLVGFSILFSFLGVILFFDRGLLALGNIFFLTGVGLLLGWQSMWQLFTKKANLKGSVPFFIGLFLLFVRWPVAGIIMELYGSFVLFSGYGPPIQAFLYQIPIIGWILQYPFQLSYLSEDITNFLRHFCIYFNGLSDKVTCIRNINVFMSLSSVRSHSRL